MDWLRSRLSSGRHGGVNYIAKCDGGTEMWSRMTSGRAHQVVAKSSLTVVYFCVNALSKNYLETIRIPVILQNK